MNTPWIVGIPLWLILGWAAFAFFEARAFRHPERQNTLSAFLFSVGQRFPLSIFLVGLLIGLFWGALATHILWHWCPPGSVSVGWLR